jgi:hypothetical protein
MTRPYAYFDLLQAILLSGLVITAHPALAKVLTGVHGMLVDTGSHPENSTISLALQACKFLASLGSEFANVGSIRVIGYWKNRQTLYLSFSIERRDQKPLVSNSKMLAVVSDHMLSCFTLSIGERHVFGV